LQLRKLQHKISLPIHVGFKLCFGASILAKVRTAAYACVRMQLLFAGEPRVGRRGTGSVVGSFASSPLSQSHVEALQEIRPEDSTAEVQRGSEVSDAPLVPHAIALTLMHMEPLDADEV
jgi:hypothetical protein